MENSKSIWNSFTNEYSLSKTLRFELKPVGRTLELIKENKLIEEDKEREKEFNRVKEIMDEYYKYFIDICLSDIEISGLKKHVEIYYKLKKANYKDEKLKSEYKESQHKITKEIYDQINKDDALNKRLGEEFIRQILPKWLETNGRIEDKKLVLKFQKWTTYFINFFSNRKNVFSKDEIPTSIIYRIVHDNLPKFLDDIAKFEELKNLKGFDYTKIEKDFSNELNDKSLEMFFSVNNFKNCINQSGIERFNLIIGGKSESNNIKIKGLNEYINEFSQKEKDNEKKIRQLKLVPLFKQILSDRNSPSFILEQINDKKEMLDKIEEFYTSFNNNLNKLKNSIKNLKKFDSEKIYLKNDESLNSISKNMFGYWGKIQEGLKLYFESKLKNKKDIEKAQNSEYFSISDIDEGIKILQLESEYPVIEYFLKFSEDYQSSNSSDKNLLSQISSKYDILKDKIKEIRENDTNKISEDDVVKIKDFLDSILSLCRFLKPLYLYSDKDKSEELELLDIDPDFYNEFNPVFQELERIVPLYNQIRNYITKKSFSTKKFKLNFDNSTLAVGWDLNKEKSNYAVLLRKKNTVTEQYDYYLGIMIKNFNKIFDNGKKSTNDQNSYEKMIYKLIPGPSKMIPKVVFSKANKDSLNPSKEILKIYNESSFTKNGSAQGGYKKKNFDIENLHKMIDFYKFCLKNYEGWSTFDFRFKSTNEYSDISEFYKDIESQGYKISWKYYDEAYINEIVDNGKLYLFQIWNKDFSEYSKGKPNLHTIYWKSLFSEENLRDIIYKLNGGAELFYREKSIPRSITHEKNKPIKNKNPFDGKEESTFEYDLIKDKRYTEDKFFFHCPITLNFVKNYQKRMISKSVNKFIHDEKDGINVLGIDRGERNLAYYSLINSNREIIEQGSFNVIFDDKKRKLDYRDKLDEIEGKRDEARKNWKNIANIKEMKEGYLSQVIHRISKLAIEHNAIITLEDLNFGFKRGRFRFEKQVYQKFEKILIDKLNYLIFKDTTEKEAGSILKAYQLTDKFESFQKLGKQSGIIFYVNASYTSKICPKTGFVNMLNPKFENVNKSKEFFAKFKYIKYNRAEDLFEFNFNYSDFTDKNEIKLKKDNWSVWSNGIRLKTRKDNNGNYWKTEEIDVTAELKKLFKDNKIDYNSEINLTGSISNYNNQRFHKDLIDLLKLILQLRNSYTSYEVEEFKKKYGDKFNMRDYDYILSCVKDNKGEFFDSRKSKNNEIKDADANGAYHIALKGLMVIKKIKESDNTDKTDLRINKNDFINYIIDSYGGKHNNI